jgi:hypothetical protein
LCVLLISILLDATTTPVDKPERWEKVRKKAGELWAEFYDAISETNEQLAERQPSEVEKLNPLVMQAAIRRGCKF